MRPEELLAKLNASPIGTAVIVLPEEVHSVDDGTVCVKMADNEWDAYKYPFTSVENRGVSMHVLALCLTVPDVLFFRPKQRNGVPDLAFVKASAERAIATVIATGATA